MLGGRGNMPAFGAKHGAGAMFFSPPALSDEQIAAVINYVRTHFGNHYADPINAAQVESSIDSLATALLKRNQPCSNPLAQS